MVSFVQHINTQMTDLKHYVFLGSFLDNFVDALKMTRGDEKNIGSVHLYSILSAANVHHFFTLHRYLYYRTFDNF